MPTATLTPTVTPKVGDSRVNQDTGVEEVYNETGQWVQVVEKVKADIESRKEIQIGNLNVKIGTSPHGNLVFRKGGEELLAKYLYTMFSGIDPLGGPAASMGQTEIFEALQSYYTNLSMDEVIAFFDQYTITTKLPFRKPGSTSANDVITREEEIDLDRVVINVYDPRDSTVNYMPHVTGMASDPSLGGNYFGIEENGVSINIVLLPKTGNRAVYLDDDQAACAGNNTIETMSSDYFAWLVSDSILSANGYNGRVSEQMARNVQVMELFRKRDSGNDAVFDSKVFEQLCPTDPR